MVCEWLKTVSLLKSELTKDNINPKKLTTIKKSCKKVKDITLLFKLPDLLKSLTEKKIIKTEQQSPKINEYDPIKLAKFISPPMQL